MNLSEWIDAHHGALARIGTECGSGFLFAGDIDSSTLERIEAYTGVEMRHRAIVEVYDSCFGGVVVICAGDEYGKVDFPAPVTAGTEIPMQFYQNLSDEIAKTVALDYEWALRKYYLATRGREREAAVTEIYMCQRFFKSASFALLMPTCDGEDIMRLIETKVKKELGS